MAENKPIIIVNGFATRYRTADGKTESFDVVRFSPAHDPMGTENVVRVKELIPPDSIRNDDEGTKLNLMKLKWAQIEPAYRAWKEGTEIPTNGTPLAAWAGVSPDQADVLRARGIKTVEALRDATDSMIAKVSLPNMRGLRELAGKFLESMTASAAAAAMAQKDEEMAAMKEMMEEMAARLAAVDGGDAPKRRGRPPKTETLDEQEAA